MTPRSLRMSHEESGSWSVTGEVWEKFIYVRCNCCGFPAIFLKESLPIGALRLSKNISWPDGSDAYPGQRIECFFCGFSGQIDLDARGSYYFNTMYSW